MNGRKLLQELLAGLDVAGRGARLDQRGTLPVLAEALVIDERGVGRERHLRGTGVGPQSQVDAEHVAVAGALLHQAYKLAGQAHEERLRLDALPQAHPLALVENDEVDVARIVELAGAVLAHGQHDVAGAHLGHGRVGRQPVALLRCLPEQEAHGALQGRVSRFSQYGRHLHHRPDAGEIGERGQQRDLGLVDSRSARMTSGAVVAASSAAASAVFNSPNRRSGGAPRMRCSRAASRRTSPAR